MSEARFTAEFKKHLKQVKKEHGNSFFYYKVSDRFTSGIPDFFLAYRGLAAYVELKDRGESPSEIQLYQMDKLQRAGIMAVWFDSIETARQFVNDFVSKRDLDLSDIGMRL